VRRIHRDALAHVLGAAAWRAYAHGVVLRAGRRVVRPVARDGERRQAANVPVAGEGAGAGVGAAVLHGGAADALAGAVERGEHAVPAIGCAGRVVVTGQGRVQRREGAGAGVLRGRDDAAVGQAAAAELALAAALSATT